MSIKKKFVTAVATAGLLAGLFGSAFVPSAMARGASVPEVDSSDGWDDTSFAFVAEQYDGTNWDNMSWYDGELSMGKNNLGLVNAPVWMSALSIGSENNNSVGSNGFANANDLSIGFYLENEDGNAITEADIEVTSTGKVEVAIANNGDTPSDNGRLNCWDNDLNDVFGLSDSLDNVTSVMDSYYSDGYYHVCVQSASKNARGDATVTIKANGVTIAAIDFHVVGDLHHAEISITEGYNRVAAANAEQDEFFTVELYDSADQQLNTSPDDGQSNYVEGGYGYAQIGGSDAGDAPENAAGNTLPFLDTNNGGDQPGLKDLEAGTCATADAGATYDVSMEWENYDGDWITSNEVAITCTGARSKAVLSGITAEYVKGEADWAASAVGEADDDGVIGIYGTVKDASGQLLGLDATVGFTVTADEVGSYTDIGLTVLKSKMLAGGKMMLGYIIPDMGTLAAKRGYTFTITDANFGTLLAQKLETTLTYEAVTADEVLYTLTRTRNAAKTSATWTADYGLMCSSSYITFYWENSDGSKDGSVSRKANADGIATFSMNRRNTAIFTYAAGCAGFAASTDQVKARFR